MNKAGPKPFHISTSLNTPNFYKYFSSNLSALYFSQYQNKYKLNHNYHNHNEFIATLLLCNNWLNKGSDLSGLLNVLPDYWTY